jgi:hypothetical protein
VLVALGIGLIVVGSFAIAATLRLNLVGSLLAAYVAASAEIVLLAEALSPFHAIRLAELLLAETLIAIGTIVFWLRRGAPRPRVPRIQLRLLGSHPTLVALGLAVFVALALEATLVLTTVPNNWDALSYHLSRAAAWYQHGSLAHLTAHTQRENVFPPNAEVQTLFTMVLLHGDRLAALPQFLAELALLVATFGIARRLGFSHTEAAFSAFLFATLSEVVLEATTTQNDLVVSACLVVGAYFLLGPRRVELWLAGGAIALGIGTKVTALFALPLLALLAVVALRDRRRMIEFTAAAIVASAFVGSWTYISNLRHDGTLLGAASVRREFAADYTVTGSLQTYWRVLYRFVDFSGVANAEPVYRPHPGVVYDPEQIKAASPPTKPSRWAFLLNGRANEDISYFGPLGALVLLPLAIGYLIAWLRRRTPHECGVLALAIPLYAAELAIAYRYNPWIGRFMLVPVALAGGLLGRAYSNRGLRVLAATLGIAFLGLALIHNEQKPLGFSGTRPIWDLSRPESEALARNPMLSTLEAIDRAIPRTATVGYVLATDDWDYPLYGSRLERRLVRLPPSDPLVRARQLGIHWVVTGDVSANGAPGWVAIRFPDSGWSVMTWAVGNGATQLTELASRRSVESGAAGSLEALSLHTRRAGGAP